MKRSEGWRDYRWEYSPLARLGNEVWQRAIDPPLRAFANQDVDFLRRTRGLVQCTLLFAVGLLPIGIFYNSGHLLTASGLLFDIAGILRLFLLEQIEQSLHGFAPNEYGNVPSVAMRELIMPEASGPYDSESHHMSLFYYKRRGIFFLFIGFLLKMAGDLLG